MLALALGQKLISLALALLMVVVANVLYVGGSLLAGLFRGLKIDEYAIFFGPGGIRFRLGRIPTRIGPLPIGGYVKFDDRSETAFSNQPLLWRFSIILAAPLLVFLAAIALLGVSTAWRSVVEGYRELALGALDLSRAVPVCDAYLQMIRNGLYVQATGITLCVVLIINLLPIPLVTGGILIIQVIQSVAGRSMAQRLASLYALVGAPVFIWLIGAWMIAFFTALARS